MKTDDDCPPSLLADCSRCGHGADRHLAPDPDADAFPCFDGGCDTADGTACPDYTWSGTP